MPSMDRAFAQATAVQLALPMLPRERAVRLYSIARLETILFVVSGYGPLPRDSCQWKLDGYPWSSCVLTSTH